MKEKHIEGIESKAILYEGIEGSAPENIREHLQDLLEHEIGEWLGRKKKRAQSQSVRATGVS